MSDYFLLYKPYAVLSQFTTNDEKRTLKEITRLPPDVYPVGRLDLDSEGLLLLTNDRSINHRLLNPDFKHEREYWVQVEGETTPDAIKRMESGVEINVNGKKYHTASCIASKFDPPPIPDRIPPIRFRKNIPTCWLKLILFEGKNRQVRKMTAAVGYPTLRLIRFRIERLTIEGMHPGEIRSLDKKQTYQGLFSDKHQ